MKKNICLLTIMKWNKRTIRLVSFFLVICSCLLIAFICYVGNCVTYYNIKSPCRIVLLADIHNSLVDITTIEKNVPDLIIVAGDIINSGDMDLSIGVALLEELVQIAPLYVSLGNHELEYEKYTGEDIVAIFEKTGAVVLDKKYVDIQIKGNSIRIGGIYGYCLPEQYNNGNEDEVDFLRNFEDTNSYKILLDHLPYSWTHYGITKDYNIDLVLAGHTHGGQVKFPIIGGLYDSEFGLFPGRVSGRFDSNETTVIVSNGIGSSEEMLPRINKSEIVVIDY